MELKFINDEKGNNEANEKFKKKLEKQLKKGLEQVKLHQEGKIKLKSLEDLINEL